MEQFIKSAVASLGGLLSWALGGFDLLLQVLVFFIAVDYITGVAAVIKHKRLSSKVGARGIAFKVLLFVPIAVAHQLDTLTGQEVLRNFVAFFYLANEGISVVENLHKCGVPVPQALVAALKTLKNEEEKKDEKD